MAYNDNLIVAYFTSDMFAEPCGVSIASLLENNFFFQKITIFIIDDKISEKNKERFLLLAEKYQREIKFIPMPNTQHYFKDERFTIESLGHTFGRLIIGGLLPDNISRVLCLDSDILVLDDLYELWNIDLSSYYVAGVDSAPGVAMMTKTLGLKPGTLYCNGGVFLCNLEKIRNDNIEAKYVEYIKSVFSDGKRLGAYEEEVINKCCYPKVLRLHPRYNLMTVNLVMSYTEFIKFRGAVNYYSEKEMAEAVNNPAIVHAINTFYIKKRIWEKDSDSPYADVYVFYRKLTKWNDSPQITVKRNMKQKIMKQVWHIFPKKIAFKLASIIRNRVRPYLNKKRDDEYSSKTGGG